MLSYRPHPPTLRRPGRLPWQCWCLFAGLAALPAPSAAQSAKLSVRHERAYVAQLAFVLEGARRALLFGEAHAADAELARFAYPLAEQYVELAGRMMPGESFKLAHPHLLLVVENVERAFAAAAHGDHQSFRQHVRTTREELSTLDGVLKHLKVRLPEAPR